MITVRQILNQYNVVTDKATNEELKLSSLADAGLFEHTKIPMIRRSLNKNINEMTVAEKKTLVGLLDSLMTHILVEEDHLSKLNTKKSPDYPTDKDLPSVIILKRKAIRVFPDHQKVGLYYSQALDRYISIPFSKDLSPQINEAKKEDDDDKDRKTQILKRLYAKHPEAMISAAQNIEAGEEKTTLHNIIRNASQKALASEPNIRKRDVIGAALSAKDAPLSARLGVALGSALGMGVRRMMTKPTNPTGSPNRKITKESFQRNLKIIREERQLNEVGPILGAIGRFVGAQAIKRLSSAAAKNAAQQGAGKLKQVIAGIRGGARGLSKSPLGKGVGIAAGITGLAAAAGGGDKSEPTFKPTGGEYSFGKVAQSAPIGAPGQQASIEPSHLAAQRRAGLVFPIQESNNILNIKHIVENNIPSSVLKIGEETISINKSIAKKIIKLHESLNKSNKKKLEKMLNENILSFRKAINFAIKQ